jgi:CRISPR-associated protein Cas2
MEREDYFFGEFRQVDTKKVYALVIYDIIENKKRVKFAKVMEGYGNRVQKSAFEVSLSEKKFEKLLTVIPKFYGMDDTIRVYRITGKNLVYKWGKDSSTNQEDLIII